MCKKDKLSLEYTYNVDDNSNEPDMTYDIHFFPIYRSLIMFLSPSCTGIFQTSVFYHEGIADLVIFQMRNGKYIEFQ